jgi:hypothetical protein
MTQTEHLQLIRARCVELLEIAEKRTAGAWETYHTENPVEKSGKVGVCRSLSSYDVAACYFALNFSDQQCESNATFIASCAGAAEAGWLTAIAAIDQCLIFPAINKTLSIQIARAWPIELLNNK